jgi:hypothetical protein
MCKCPLNGGVSCRPAVRVKSGLVATTWVVRDKVPKEGPVSVGESVVVVVWCVGVTGRLLTTSEREGATGDGSYDSQTQDLRVFGMLGECRAHDRRRGALGV